MVALGLCQGHYSRQRRGMPLIDTGPRIGSPSGHGRYGIVDRTEDAALCHECGQWFESVGAHLRRGHGMTAAEYRARHGLKRTEPLTGRRASEERAAWSRERVGTAAWRRLEAARDPAAAAAARDEAAFHTPGARRGRQERAQLASDTVRGTGREHPCAYCGQPITGRRMTCSDECTAQLRSDRAFDQIQDRYVPLTAEQRAQLDTATGVDLDRLVRQLIDQGVASASIAAALGITRPAMSRRWPRRPPTLERRKPPPSGGRVGAGAL